MPTRIYHKDHGYVITNDQAEIDMLLAKGGKADRIKKENPAAVEQVEPPQVKPKPVEVPEVNKRK